MIPFSFVERISEDGSGSSLCKACNFVPNSQRNNTGDRNLNMPVIYRKVPFNILATNELLFVVRNCPEKQDLVRDRVFIYLFI